MKTPRRLLVAALIIWAGFAVLHLAGGRATLSAISLTVPEGVDFTTWLAGCAVYLLAWFGATLVAPVLALSAAMLGALNKRPCTPS